MKDTKLEVFEFNGERVQVIPTDNGSFTVEANLVCQLLGYANPRDAISRHCKPDGVVKRDIIDSMGRNQVATFITEPNLYRLIARSQLESAKEFEAWVFEGVLPSIRRKGHYSHEEFVAEKRALEAAHTAEKKQLVDTYEDTLQRTARHVGLQSSGWLKDLARAERAAEHAEGTKRHAEVLYELQSEVVRIVEEVLPHLPKKERREIEDVLEWRNNTLRKLDRKEFFSTRYYG